MRLFGCAVVFLFLSCVQVRAQKISFSEKRSSQHTHVKGSDFEGVVFSEQFMFPFLDHQSGDRRFTPTISDIEKAELLLVKNIRAVNSPRLKQGGDFGPVIDQNLKSYIRQYYGYFTDRGEKIVFISCLLKTNYKSEDKVLPNWLKGAVVVLNGGSNYWQVQANLSTSSLFGLEVNGLDKMVSR
jgi:hypothetical protein